jgi:lysyl-tRNA synthetase class 1
LNSSGNVKGKISSEEKKVILLKLKRTKAWIEKYSPNSKISFVPLEEVDQSKIDSSSKSLLPALAQKIAKAKDANAVQEIVYNEAKANNIEPQKLFAALYLSILNKERGPRFGSLVFAFGKEKVCERLKKLA